MILPGMLACTSMVLLNTPLSLGSKVTSMVPFWPVFIGRLGLTTLTQRHVVEVRVISSGALPSLVNSKEKVTSASPWFIVPKLWLDCSKRISALPLLFAFITPKKVRSKIVSIIIRFIVGALWVVWGVYLRAPVLRRNE